MVNKKVKKECSIIAIKKLLAKLERTVNIIDSKINILLTEKSQSENKLKGFSVKLEKLILASLNYN